MISRNLLGRLGQLEARLPAARESFSITLQFIEPGSMAIVRTLVIENGQQKWLHAPGRSVDADEERAVAASKDAQMSAGVLR